jgi:hypothetical protein
LRAHELRLRMRFFDSQVPAPQIGEKVLVALQMDRVSYFDPQSGRALL